MDEHDGLVGVQLGPDGLEFVIAEEPSVSPLLQPPSQHLSASSLVAAHLPPYVVITTTPGHLSSRMT